MDALKSDYAVFYDVEVQSLFRFILFRINDRERAKELVNDAFLKLWQQVAGGKKIENQRAYLYMTARNLIKNEYRSRREHNEGEEPLETMTDDGVLPEDYARYREVRKHLKAIPPQYAEVLTMRYLSGLAVKDIAAIIGTTETNISMRIKRGMEALKTYYEPT